MNDLSFLKSWLHTRNPVGTTDREHEKIIEEFEQFFAYIFNNSKEGISILDPDLTILGARRFRPSSTSRPGLSISIV